MNDILPIINMKDASRKKMALAKESRHKRWNKDLVINEKRFGKLHTNQSPNNHALTGKATKNFFIQLVFLWRI